MARPGSGDPEIHRITAARRPHSDDQDQRVVRYLVSMMIRTVCLVLVVVLHGHLWLQIIFGAGAVFLPYVAVVLANAGGEPRQVMPPPGVTPPQRPALGGGRTSLGGERPPSEGDRPNG
jgi:hypothetical protein